MVPYGGLSLRGDTMLLCHALEIGNWKSEKVVEVKPNTSL